MLDEIKLLDHGYLKLIEHWGSDERVIESARMSTNKGFLGWGGDCQECSGNKYILETDICLGCSGTGKSKPGDEKLLKYLYDNWHHTPFEMAGAIIEVQAPILVFREWMRHRSQSYNEMSGRYSPLPDMNYVPSIERLMANFNGKNKQAGTIPGAGVLTEALAEQYRQQLMIQYAADETFYQWSLSAGVPKEIARNHLPVGRYSRMRAQANLRNWLAFLTLRQDKAAQHEIRVYADAMCSIIAQLFPRTHALYIG